MYEYMGTRGDVDQDLPANGVATSTRGFDCRMATPNTPYTAFKTAALAVSSRCSR